MLRLCGHAVLMLVRALLCVRYPEHFLGDRSEQLCTERGVRLQWQALGACAGGMAFFAGLYGVAAYMDKASTVPYVRCLPLVAH